LNSERYHRQLILKGFGEAAQQKLALARVLVIGAGGLGCPALQYLSAAGLGHIGIVDDDVVSLSNLHRQILYTTADIGKFKVEVAAQRLREQNPEIEVKTYLLRLERNIILDLLKAYDYILDGTDNFESRYLINDACSLLKKPLIFAAVSGYEGQLAVFNVADQANNTTNYRDLFPIPPQEGEVLNCSENGVLGVLPGIIGTMQAAEVIKLITGIGTPLVNKILNYNLLNHQFYEIRISHADDTYTIPETEAKFLAMSKPIYGNKIINIDGEEFDALRKRESTLLIDVRESHEFPVLDPAVFLKAPMSGFPASLNQEVVEENIVLICQHGIRSVAAAEWLKEKYGSSKHIYSLNGGIVKWSGHFIDQEHER